MEVMLIPLLILFFILVAGFGIENTFKILPPLIILGLLIYFLGWVAVRYFWIILPIWFVSKLLSNKNKGKIPHIQEHIEELMMISLTLVQQIEQLMVEHLTVERKQKSFLELSLVEILDKVQQVLVAELMVDIVVKMVAVAIKELLIHIHQIKVDIILF